MHFKSHPCYFNVLIVAFLMAFTGCTKTDTAISKPIPDCFDNIQNQGELGIDCGGPCNPCPAKMTAKIDGVLWESEGNITTLKNSTAIQISASNGTSTLSIGYSGPFVTGTFNQQSGSYVAGYSYTTNQGATITFSEWNEQENQVFGSFNFNAVRINFPGDTIHVTDGTFEFVTY